MADDAAKNIAGMTGEKAVSIVAAEPIITGATTFYTSRGTLVQAMKGNTEVVYVGGSACTIANGLEIYPGDSIFIPTNDPSDIWVVAVVAGQKVRGMGI